MHLWEEVGPLLHPWEATKHEEEEEESNEEEEEVSPLGGDQASENNCVHGDPDNVVLHTVFHPLGGGGTSPRTPGRLPTTRRRRSTTRRRRRSTTMKRSKFSILWEEEGPRLHPWDATNQPQT